MEQQEVMTLMVKMFHCMRMRWLVQCNRCNLSNTFVTRGHICVDEFNTMNFEANNSKFIVTFDG